VRFPNLVMFANHVKIQIRNEDISWPRLAHSLQGQIKLSHMQLW